VKCCVLLAMAAALAFAQDHPSGVVDANIANVSNLPAEKLAANDLIAVSVYDAPELTRTLRIDPDGTITLPMLSKPIVARGLLPRQLERAIAAALEKAQILVDPLVKVTVMEYFSRPISVIGAVRRPVTFQAIGRVTLLEALARAQGLTDAAGLYVIVTHADPAAPVERIAVKDLMNGTDPAANVVLHGGEEIRVPDAERIFVVGDVRRPGAFPVRDSAGMTVLKTIALAEGLAPYSANVAYVYRRGTDASAPPREIPVPLKKILKRQAEDVVLEPNDILYVPESGGRRLGVAALEKIVLFGSTAGATALVWRP
jgi:polysaccharide biosynthesis/export protein